MATKYSNLTDSSGGAAVIAGAIHAGLNVRVGVHSLNGTSLSAGDVLQMVPVPHGATVVDTILQTKCDKVAFTVGDGDDADRYIVTTTMSDSAAAQHAQTGVGHQYDISDDVADDLRYDTVDVTVGTVTSATSGGSVILTVLYHMEDGDPA